MKNTCITIIKFILYTKTKQIQFYIMLRQKINILNTFKLRNIFCYQHTNIIIEKTHIKYKKYHKILKKIITLYCLII